MQPIRPLGLFCGFIANVGFVDTVKWLMAPECSFTFVEDLTIQELLGISGAK